MHAQLSLMTLGMMKELVRKTMTVRDTLQVALDSEIPYVDVGWVKGKQTLAYRDALRETGLKVHCFNSTVSFLRKERTIRNILKRDMTIAAGLGATLFMIVPYNLFLDCRKAKRLGRTAVLERMIKGFRLAVEMGKTYGLAVCFETTPEESIHLSGAEDCRYILEQVPELGLVFDTANMLPHGDDPLASYEALKDRIVHVHLKDVALVNEKPSMFEPEVAADGRLMRATVFGNGVIPVKEIYDRMRADGYTGTFAIEYIRPKADCCSIQEHENHLKAYLKHLME